MTAGYIRIRPESERNQVYCSMLFELDERLLPNLVKRRASFGDEVKIWKVFLEKSITTKLCRGSFTTQTCDMLRPNIIKLSEQF